MVILVNPDSMNKKIPRVAASALDYLCVGVSPATVGLGSMGSASLDLLPKNCSFSVS